MMEFWNDGIQFIKELDLTPFLISLKTGVMATIVCFFLGIGAAAWSGKAKGIWKVILDSLLTLPMVLPPTVVGFFLLLFFSTRRPVGMFLEETMQIRVVQTWLGCVLAATVIAFPLMYRNARAAFEQVDGTMIDAARTLGMSEWSIFWKILLPNAKPGLYSGAILTFARAIGEYGATSMLAGNIPGKTGTISQKIAMVIQDGDYATAGFWAVFIVIVSFSIMVTVHLFQRKR